MKVIHVLRKPLSEGTVAANTLKHGTGGLNIDKARVAAPGEEITTHTQKTGEDGYASNAVYGDYEGGFTTHQTEGQKLGRWPGNLILQHLDGCRCEGVKKVRGISGGRSSGDNAFGQDAGWNAHQNRPTDITRPMDEDGKETVAHWVCVEGCPVRALDEQSGACPSTGNHPSTAKNTSIYRPGQPPMAQGRLYADNGGASRFFKQVGNHE